MVNYGKEYTSTVFKVYHKIVQVIFNRELLVTDNARSMSKHTLLLKVFLYSLGVTLNV